MVYNHYDHFQHSMISRTMYIYIYKFCPTLQQFTNSCQTNSALHYSNLQILVKQTLAYTIAIYKLQPKQILAFTLFTNSSLQYIYKLQPKQNLAYTICSNSSQTNSSQILLKHTLAQRFLTWGPWIGFRGPCQSNTHCTQSSAYVHFLGRGTIAFTRFSNGSITQKHLRTTIFIYTFVFVSIFPEQVLLILKQVER